MHLIYYDEVKYDPPKQDRYWLGGICVPSQSVPEIEDEVNSIADDIFGSRTLRRSTEIHGIELCRGNGNFKGREFDLRLDALARLLAILKRDDVFQIIACINPGNLAYTSADPDEIAFMFFIEQVDILLSEKDSLGMLFGDYDEPMIGRSVASLSQYREIGTDWRRAREITNLIDTVHFARSHHSRLIQLADVFLYCYQFERQENQAPWRAKIAQTIKDSGALFLNKHRFWPQERTWYR
ncbi:MAG TPA: hypothetical protein DCG48_04400 [Rhodospirillaceae bacterium]|nr:hypothetical protein [Rhodospirillaceae bacterium]|tara:strand:- start:16104 stop:16820 length:717 start_codon:yes stop_codon:yes gene_type:complete